MKKIIVPVDFLEHSEFALKAAAQFAKKYDAEILVLHMLEMTNAILTASGGFANEQAVFFVKLAEQKFEEFLQKPYLESVKVTPIIKYFKVFSEINDVAEKNDAHLIIMGSHGSSGFSEFFLGSNTERVVRSANIPVLVIKNELNTISFESAAFACDFSEASINAYLKAESIMKTFGGNLHLVHVNRPNELFKSTSEIETLVANFFEKAKIDLGPNQSVHFVSDYTVEDGIMNFSKNHGIDLLIIPTNGRKGLAHFFEGSISEDIANHATIPVVTFKMS